MAHPIAADKTSENARLDKRITTFLSTSIAGHHSQVCHDQTTKAHTTTNQFFNFRMANIPYSLPL
jgi:hypothetical protein